MHIFTKLRNIYWQIRYVRRKSSKRKFYRYAAAEKKRLIASGVDLEELSLLCRTLSARLNVNAEKRLADYSKTK